MRLAEASDAGNDAPDLAVSIFSYFQRKNKYKIRNFDVVSTALKN